jgi:hypothetical protein
MANKKKITNLSELNQMDGRLVEKDTVPTTLDSLFGNTGLGKYTTIDENAYASQLESYNVAELRNHAINIGLIPIASVPRLKKQLLVEFRKFALGVKNPTKPANRQLSLEKQKIGLSILSAVK